MAGWVREEPVYQLLSDALHPAIYINYRLLYTLREINYGNTSR